MTKFQTPRPGGDERERGENFKFLLLLLYAGTWRRGDLKELGILGVPRHVAAFGLGDMSPSSKASRQRRDPRTPYFDSQFAFMRGFKQKPIAGRSPTLPTFPTVLKVPNVLNVLDVLDVLQIRNCGDTTGSGDLFLGTGNQIDFCASHYLHHSRVAGITNERARLQQKRC